jgi:hypothetical protein
LSPQATTSSSTPSAEKLPWHAPKDVVIPECFDSNVYFRTIKDYFETHRELIYKGEDDSEDFTSDLNDFHKGLMKDAKSKVLSQHKIYQLFRKLSWEKNTSEFLEFLNTAERTVSCLFLRCCFINVFFVFIDRFTRLIRF